MRITVLTGLLLIAFSALAQNKFPQGWLGTWKGELEWFKTGNPEPQKVAMELRITALDSVGIYNWQLVYGDAGKDNRPYLLKVKDVTKGHWVIDELNGIILDQFWVGNKFCGAFTVLGNTIVNNYWMENGQLIVEFFSIAAKPIATTGIGTEQSPNVDCYRVGSYQKAVLKRE